jgi:DNA-binding CsgD family transcriptional regulator
VAIEPKPGRCWPRREPSWRGIPTQAYSLSFSSAKKGSFARRPQEEQLTERELDVLRLLGGESSVRQIAQSLYVAPSTVRTQVKSVYRKLGVSSRKEAVEEAYVRGLI